MSELNLPDIASFAAPVYIAFILLELALVMLRRARGTYETRDATASLLMGAGSVFFDLLLKSTVYTAIFSMLYAVWLWSPLNMGVHWWVFPVALVLDDLRYYWAHRLQHEIRWGWANHVIHHSSQHFNLTTALRQPWFSFLTGAFVLRLPLVLIGIHPAILVFSMSFNLVYQFFTHTEAVGKLPKWVEAVMNTPSHHRVHHGRNARYLDANYAGIFIVWDRLFGTFVEEDEAEPVRYGIVHSLGTFNPLRIMGHEYLSIFRDVARPGLGMKARLLYIFGPPGWSHDGSRRTSTELKRDHLRRHPEEAGLPGLPQSLAAAEPGPVPAPAE